MDGASECLGSSTIYEFSAVSPSEPSMTTHLLYEHAAPPDPSSLPSSVDEKETDDSDKPVSQQQISVDVILPELQMQAAEGDLLEEEFMPDESANLEEKHRLKSSSYEDIYIGVKGPLEDEDDVIMPVGGPIEIGDRFDTRHVDPQFKDGEAKSSSFENLYEASKKEAGDVEEKDVDEREGDLESETDRPEKGVVEDEKENDGVIATERKTTRDFSLDHVEAEIHATRSPPIFKYPSPIDVTLESGLDQVGQEDQSQLIMQLNMEEPSREVLERSHSYDVGHDQEEDPRQRHYSSPDAVLLQEDTTATTYGMDKGTYWQPLSLL